MGRVPACTAGTGTLFHYLLQFCHHFVVIFMLFGTVLAEPFRVAICLVVTAVAHCCPFNNQQIFTYSLPCVARYTRHGLERWAHTHGVRNRFFVRLPSAPFTCARLPTSCFVLPLFVVPFALPRVCGDHVTCVCEPYPPPQLDWTA